MNRILFKEKSTSSLIILRVYNLNIICVIFLFNFALIKKLVVNVFIEANYSKISKKIVK